jgi:ferric-dicitrate binding protein FerR (iron transport regulator)
MTSHDPVTPRARQLFETAVERLDTPAAQRLQRARRHALDARPVPARMRLVGIPAGAFAAAVLALGLAWWLPGRAPVPGEAAATATASPLDADAMVTAEDAELYAWLGDAPVATEQAERGL